MSIIGQHSYSLPKQFNYQTYSTPTQNNDNSLGTARKEILINWVNSLEYPNCLLASELSEFKNGVIFCEIINEIVLRNQKPDFLPRIKQHNPSFSDVMENISMALSEIRSIKNFEIPKQVLEIKDTDLTSDDSKVIALLDFLYNYSMNVPTKPNQAEQNRLSADFSNDQITYDKYNPFADNLMPTMNSTGSTMPSTSYNNSFKTSQKPPLMPTGNNKMRSPNNSLYKKTGGNNISQINPNDSVNMNSGQKKEFFSPNDPMRNYLGQSASPTAQDSTKQTTPRPQLYGYEDPKSQQNRNPSPFIFGGQDSNTSGVIVNDFLDPESSMPPFPNYNKFQDPDSPFQEKKRPAPGYINYDDPQTQYELESSNNFRSVNEQPEREKPRKHQSEKKLPSHREMNSNILTEQRTISPRPMGLYEKSIPLSDESESRIVSTETKHRMNNNKKSTSHNRDSQLSDHMRVEHLANDENANPNTTKREKKWTKRDEITRIATEGDVKAKSRERSTSFVREKKEEAVVTPVSEDLKEKILNWLFALTMIKENIPNLTKKLPKICKNGLIFVDLINRLEGKHDTIKGINRNPKNKSHFNTNFIKIIDYLRQFEKMNPRYLQASEMIIEGNEDVFWGFFDDIWHLYNKKVSPYDPRYKKDASNKSHSKSMNISKLDASTMEKSFKSAVEEISYNDILYHDRSTRNLPSSSPISQSKKVGFDNSFLTRGKESKLDASAFKDRTPSKEQEKPEPEKSMAKQTSYSDLRKKTQPYLSSTPTAKSQMTKRLDSQNPSPMVANKQRSATLTEREILVTLEQETEIMEWLKTLGLKTLMLRKSEKLFGDPFRNGTLLCLVVSRVENEKLNGVFLDPKTIDECRFNIYKALSILRQKRSNIPSYFWGKEEAFLTGDRNLVLGLLFQILKQQEEKNETEVSAVRSINKGFMNDVSSFVPPYSEADFKKLGDSIIDWMNSLGLFIELDSKPESIKELTIHMKSGVILADLVQIVTKQKVATIYKKATTDIHCQTNIRKSLEVLRNIKMMGQKYLWKEREILSGDQYIIMGLLEDLHRLYDDMPPRKNPNYFFDGPYIPTVLRRNHFDEKSNIVIPPSGQEQRTQSKDSRPRETSKDKLTIVPDKSAMPVTQTSHLIPRGLPNSVKTEPNEKLTNLNLSSDEPVSLMGMGPKTGKPQKRLSIESIPRIEDGSVVDSIKLEDMQIHSRLSMGPRLSPKSKKPQHSESLIFRSQDMDVSRKYIPSPRNELTQLGSTEDNTVTTMNSKEKDLDFQLKEYLSLLGFSAHIRTIDFNANVIEEFKDGIFLCKIIEKLEMKEIPGVILKPKTNASKLVNIRKCLAVLAKQPGVNPHLLHIEDKIIAGHGETIRQLLFSIKSAYRFVNKCIMKTQSVMSNKWENNNPEEENQTNITVHQSNKWGFYNPDESYVLNPEQRKKMIVPIKYSK